MSKKSLKTLSVLVIGVVLAVAWGLLNPLLRPSPGPALTFVVIPADEASLTEEQFAPLIEYLSTGLDVEIQLMTVTDYTAVVEAMKYGHADIARFGPASYVMATEEADVEAIACALKAKTGEASYTSLIITLADSGITDLEGISMAYTDVGSTSGYLVPSTYIMKAGIELGEIFFTGSQSAVIEAVRNGSVDAGCMADNRYYMAIEEGVIAEDDFTVLWQSDPIPNSPVAVQRSMDPKLKAELTAILLAAPRELVEHLGIGEIGYVAATDSDYDLIREIAEAHRDD